MMTAIFSVIAVGIMFWGLIVILFGYLSDKCLPPLSERKARNKEMQMWRGGR